MTGFVYFIAPEAVLHRHEGDDGKVVKIGYTKSSPFARLKTLQTGCPLPLKVWAYTPGDEYLEHALHRAFANLRHLGEWFYAHDKLEDLLVCLGDEPDVGNLIEEDHFASIVADTIFTDHPPHPSVDAARWRRSATPAELAGFFPDEWVEYLS